MYWIQSVFIKSISIFILGINFLISTSYATSDVDKVKDDVIGVISALTCETQGVGNLLRSEFAHTCSTSSLIDLVMANIIAPITYANMMLRLKISDPPLFADNCARENRADPNDPFISFGICSNTLLTVERALGIAKVTFAIASAIINGTDGKEIWTAVTDAWMPDKQNYHEFFMHKRIGDSGTMVDIGIMPLIPWKVIKIADRICVATWSLDFANGNYTPVGCKYIKEPQPVSIYSSFMDKPGASAVPNTPNDPTKLTVCSTIGKGGCYQRVQTASMAGIIITSPIIECVNQMLLQLMVGSNVCQLSDIDRVMEDSSQRVASSFFLFQRNMQRIVLAFITLYVIFFASNMVLAPDSVTKSELINFIIKIFFVTYFSVGINVKNGTVDGITQFVLPLLLSGLQSFASWIMTASPNGLCVFNAQDYVDGMSHLALWDAVDCRVSQYLGLDMMRTMAVENAMREHDFANMDFFSLSIPPYYYLLIPAIIIGNPTLVSLALMYPILVISIVAYLVNATVVCMIGIVMLSFLAPLFVPMYLFSYTKGYFNNWVQLTISFVLQPMVVVTFIITLFTVYDYGFYGKCRYTSQEIPFDKDFYNRKNKVFFIDNKWSNYPDDDAENCKNSLGYMLNNPIAFMYDMNRDTIEQAVGNLTDDTEEYTGKFDFLKTITAGPGLFITRIKVIKERLRKIIISLLVACFSLYLMHHFSAQISEFAADMSLGISLSDVTLNPKATFDKMMSAVGAAGGAAAGGAGGGGGGGGKPPGGGGKPDLGGSDKKLRPNTGDLDKKFVKDDLGSGKNTDEKNRKLKAFDDAVSDSGASQDNSVSSQLTKAQGNSRSLQTDAIDKVYATHPLHDTMTDLMNEPTKGLDVNKADEQTLAKAEQRTRIGNDVMGEFIIDSAKMDLSPEEFRKQFYSEVTKQVNEENEANKLTQAVSGGSSKDPRYEEFFTSDIKSTMGGMLNSNSTISKQSFEAYKDKVSALLLQPDAQGKEEGILQTLVEKAPPAIRDKVGAVNKDILNDLQNKGGGNEQS